MKNCDRQDGFIAKRKRFEAHKGKTDKFNGSVHDYAV